MQTLTGALLFIIIAILIYVAFSPRPLPDIPHRARLPWMTGDIPFLVRVEKATGSMTRAFDMMVQELGPVCQVLPSARWNSCT